jgi:hypothetical protein
VLQHNYYLKCRLVNVTTYQTLRIKMKLFYVARPKTKTFRFLSVTIILGLFVSVDIILKNFRKVYENKGLKFRVKHSISDMPPRCLSHPIRPSYSHRHSVIACFLDNNARIDLKFFESTKIISNCAIRAVFAELQE